MYHRDFLKKKAIKTGSTHFHNAYKKARNNLSKSVKDTKANYYNNAINQCNKDSKSMWKTINQLTNKKSKTAKINELIIDQKVTTNPDEIAEVEVKSEISRIKTSKATGHDRISPKLLKDSVEIIAESLTNIFNKSIEKGVFPDDLKIACISPIHKGG
ncbi:Hypothetical predicted protein [Paramuricea clavata]|uniref:Uncharacterized protein n=1 Tax=Paramuricea clavata TaxID=317549 RepID=A0A7D9KYY2_PARCT|nr:Hypothetical predicted protein [Paramuricea clavata]